MKEKDNSSRPLLGSKKGQLIRIGVVALLLLIVWLVNTPPGLMGKSDAIGYAVCHRISSHSFYFGDRPFSLCARCSGQYLGFLWGYAVHLVFARKRSGFPSWPLLVGMGVLFLFYVIDSVNSLLYVYPGLGDWALYQPNNNLRLSSGLGMGLVISMLLYPLIGQTLWKDYSPEPSVSRFKEWALLFLGTLMVAGLVLSKNPLLLYPLVLLSSFSVLVLLSLLYCVIWVLVTRRENSFTTWDELIWFLLAGFSSGLMQIMLIDGIRFLLTGTWSGFLDY
jgi:uncharacterized membrane protein